MRPPAVRILAFAVSLLVAAESHGPVVERSDPEASPWPFRFSRLRSQWVCGWLPEEVVANFVGLLFALGALGFVRDTNDYLLGIVAIAAAVAALVTPAVRRRAVALGDWCVPWPWVSTLRWLTTANAGSFPCRTR